MIYNGPWSRDNRDWRATIVTTFVPPVRSAWWKERKRDREIGGTRSPPVPYWFLAPFKRVVTLVDWPFLNTKPPTMSRRILDRYQSQTCVCLLVYKFSVRTIVSWAIDRTIVSMYAATIATRNLDFYSTRPFSRIEQTIHRGYKSRLCTL